MAQPPTLGALYPDSPGVYPAYSQPGGPGTPTFPAQTDGEKIGLFNAGCNHFFNCWRVQSYSYVDDLGATHLVALVQCPVCSYLQQVVDPYSKIYTFEFYYIIG